MEELSWEYDRIFKSRDQVARLPKLHLQSKYWLINEREEKDNPYSFIDVYNSIEKGIILLDEIEKTKEILRLCSFNLTEEFVIENLISISEKILFIGVNEDLLLNSFLNFLIQVRNHVEKCMSKYLLIKPFDLRVLIKDEYFINTINNNMKAVSYLLLEVRYNIVNYNSLLCESVDGAISESGDLLKLNIEILSVSFQSEDKKYQEDLYEKYLGCEKKLKKSITYLKKDLKG